MHILEEVVPDVIRLSGAHVAKFLPLLCSPPCARYIVVEPPCVSSDVISFYRSLELLQSTQWKVLQLPFGKRVAPAKHMPSRRTLFVAEQI